MFVHECLFIKIQFFPHLDPIRIRRISTGSETLAMPLRFLPHDSDSLNIFFFLQGRFTVFRPEPGLMLRGRVAEVRNDHFIANTYDTFMVRLEDPGNKLGGEGIISF